MTALVWHGRSLAVKFNILLSFSLYHSNFLLGTHSVTQSKSIIPNLPCSCLCQNWNELAAVLAENRGTVRLPPSLLACLSSGIVTELHSVTTWDNKGTCYGWQGNKPEKPRFLIPPNYTTSPDSLFWVHITKFQTNPNGKTKTVMCF